ncbi:putative phosphomannomutase [Agromyces sp. NDB4Y10]|uniref:phospho-sugar mutase n=1 Tax=Agromyces sp. NDB4Y10 TaxID=1775951 RepID=UPI0007B22E9E|nr:phospho-sugar mutase [Agromyces sp. NDB4Y10]KZE93683.1 putative phosphomannomutase [Agromyces sp. NDB4Y10]
MPQLTDDDRIALAEAWIAQDPDPETRDELASIVAGVRAGDAAASADLADRFDARLAFGTAGLRGEIAAGPNRMNRVLVSQGAAGLAAYLLERATEAGSTSVVVGYDGRRNSEVFARDVAEVMAGAGVRAILLPRMLPTPVLAFAVRHLDASAGVMVTASHNPPNDNGMKVYLGGADQGTQIVAPADAEIAAHILRVADSVRVPDLPRGSFETAPESVVDAYVTATAAVAATPAAQPRVVYTAMHGVGWETLRRVLDTAGFDAPTLVEAQTEPDGRFPTVVFPNPEEPGAMDLSFEAARASGADLIVANDPDADRLAIAIPDASEASGWRRLTGNEVGLLLGWQVAEQVAAAGRDGTLACSIVSSPGLEAVARAHGLDFRATLTGFKWISRAPGLAFGFEEALGYLVNPDTVRDKDGISAAVAFLSLAARLAAEGRTVADHLDDFTARFGCFASAQVSIRVTDLSRIAEVMARLRAAPPSEVGGIRVAAVEDLALGLDGLPPSDVLRIRLEGGARVMVRPSGTEPKLKVYIDAAATEGSVAERRAAASEAVARVEAGMRELVA